MCCEHLTDLHQRSLVMTVSISTTNCLSCSQGPGGCCSLFQLSPGEGRARPWTRGPFSAGPHRKKRQKRLFARALHPRVPSCPHMHVFGLEEEAGEPGEPGEPTQTLGERAQRLFINSKINIVNNHICPLAQPF